MINKFESKRYYRTKLNVVSRVGAITFAIKSVKPFPKDISFCRNSPLFVLPPIDGTQFPDLGN